MCCCLNYKGTCEITSVANQFLLSTYALRPFSHIPLWDEGISFETIDDFFWQNRHTLNSFIEGFWWDNTFVSYNWGAGIWDRTWEDAVGCRSTFAHTQLNLLSLEWLDLNRHSGPWGPYYYDTVGMTCDIDIQWYFVVAGQWEYTSNSLEGCEE